jgi:ribosomal protein S18 acetylase RimI-like enzyme
MNDFTIRPYQNSDKRDVIKLWDMCDLIVPQNDPEKDIYEKMSFQPDLFFIGNYNKVLIGTIMVGYDGHRGWIYYLAVHPGYRRNGFGNKLMNHAAKVLSDMGCSKINVQIREYNAMVIGFYKKLGYTDDHVISLGKRIRK